jgi:hypothetical protein
MRTEDKFMGKQGDAEVEILRSVQAAGFLVFYRKMMFQSLIELPTANPWITTTLFLTITYER